MCKRSIALFDILLDLLLLTYQQQQSNNRPSAMVVGTIGTHREEIATLREKIDSVEGKLELILQLLDER
jgi:hypothetical protein